MPGTHALLSASSAERWLNCPPSARLNAEIEDKGSEYAAEGTLAHSMCEIKLTGYISAIPKRTTNSKLNKLKKDELYQSEMDGYTDDYLNYVKEITIGLPGVAMIRVEEQVDYSDYAPEGFGTADCLILYGDELHVLDFKYGRGVEVSAEDNPQLKLYALGAMKKFAFLYAVKNVVLHIVQPRIGNFSRWETTAAELRAWGECIKPIAQLAYEGKGDFNSGSFCRFCKLSATCRKRSEDNLALAQFEFRKPAELTHDGSPALTDEEIGRALTLGSQLKKWYDDLEKYALGMIISGKKYDGWKAVEGRGSRNFTNPNDVPNILEKMGLSPDLAYERAILSPAKLESVVGKKDFADYFSGIVEKSKGKPTLAPQSDKRPDYVSGTTAAEDFSEEIPRF